MSLFFTSIYKYFKKRRALLFGLLGFLVVFLAYNASQIKLEEDITKMMPSTGKIRTINETLKSLKSLDNIAVNIFFEDSTVSGQEYLLKEYAEAFMSKLLELDSTEHLISDVSLQMEDESLLTVNDIYLENLPVFLEESDYEILSQKISPEAIETGMANNFRNLMSPSGMALKQNILKDPLGISGPVLEKLASLQVEDNFELDEGFVFTKDKRNLLCFIKPEVSSQNTAENKLLMEYIDEAIAFAQSQNGEEAIKTEYFGTAVVATGNASRIKQDIVVTLSITIIALFVLITYFFKRWSSFFVIFIPVLFGVLFSMGMLFLIRDSVSVIAIGAGSVVLGISVDFAIHFYAHFKHTNSAVATIKDLAFPLTLGGFTTIGAFLSLLFVDSEALQDFGIFAALTLGGTALFILILYPHLLKEYKRDEAFVLKENFITKIGKYPFEKNKWLIAFILILAFVSIFTSKKVDFESDMMKMNYMSDETREAEKHLSSLSHDYGTSTIYLVAKANELNDALLHTEANIPLLEELKEEGKINKYTDVDALLLSKEEQAKRIDRWNAFWTEEKKASVKERLLTEGSKYKFKADAFSSFYALLDKDITPIDEATYGDSGKGILENFISNGNTVITTIKAPLAYEKEIIDAFEGNVGIDIFSKKYLTNSFVLSIKNNFNLILGISSILVFVFLLISYGRLELALITYIPMIVSWLIILGLMGMFGLKFNIINIIISTFIFGLGDDYSIFITDALSNEYKTGKKNLSNYKSSIFLSAFTTIIGIGVLVFAQHPALKSIGLIAVIGMFSVLLVSNTIQPALYNFMITKRAKKKRVPLTIMGLIRSIFAFVYFAIGCFIVMTVGIVILKLLPLPLKTRKRWFHKVRSLGAKSMIYVNTHVTKRKVNPLNENFEKPAMVITNHHSVIDSLLMQSLSPKLILMVNDWVWKNTFMGPIVRMGGFIPKEAGYDENLVQIRELIAEGYSIAIFPEGSRSPSEKLRRFHKGAFFLADKLDLDIVPIIFHGTAYVQGREDNFLLKPGEITVKYLPRIKPDDSSFGEGYAKRTKAISAYFKEEYANLRAERETVDYFFDRLRTNYIYKGPVLEWYMKIKVKLEENYKLFDSILPKKGVISDIGSGYGFLPLMLGFRSSERTIYASDYDENKIAVANNCFSKTENISFETADATKSDLRKSDAFVLSDVLHYLPSAEQEKLIVKTIESLNPNGLILIRDGDKDLEERHKGTKLTEFMSTNIGFNKTQNKLAFLSGRFIEKIATKHKLSFERIDNTKNTSNVIYVLRK
ncbi:MMPL family transporter [uncultured Arcticibacterium sp.]|uniref:MMPL family transporter n=1 Tax=uncultured Arcticibacterium sp. TaxID=2173042 RepID=UPI0030F4D79C